MTEIKEGYMPFGQYQTYYRIAGAPSDKAPILMLHGGPGSTHNYFELFDEFADRDHRQVITYDQIGCGKSSMPDDHAELYNAATWVKELKMLRDYLHLDRVHLLGQSWGGMLEIIYLCDEMSSGIKSATFASTLSSSQLWGHEQHRMIKFMSKHDQSVIAKAETSGNYDDPEYQKVDDKYMLLHCEDTPTANSPECLKRKKKFGTVAYETAWGPNEYTPLGNLKNYDYTSKLRHMYVPTLITSGTNDLCTPLVAKTMADALPNCKWVLFDGTRHMSFVEQPEKYQKILQQWLDDHD